MTNLLSIFIVWIIDHLILLLSIVVSFILFTFFLDGCKLSTNKIINKLQIVLFIIIVLLIILFLIEILYPSTPSMNGPSGQGTSGLLKYLIVENCTDNSTVNVTASNSSQSLDKTTVSGSITLSTSDVLELSKGISSASRNIGLGASIGGVAAAAAKVASGTPMQKLAMISLGGVVGGTLHVGASAASRAIDAQTSSNVVHDSGVRFNKESSLFIADKTNSDYIDVPLQDYWTASSINEPGNGVNNLLESIISSSDPFLTLISSIYILQICNLILIFYLSTSLLSKLLINSDWLSTKPWLREQKVISFLIKYLGKSSTINIFIIIVLLTISVAGSTYFLQVILNNLEIMCKVYLKSKGT
jgi:hypothetical protein